MTQTVESWARELLRCPDCGGELRDAAQGDGTLELVCVPPAGSAAKVLGFPVVEGIPVLLVSDARTLDDETVA